MLPKHNNIIIVVILGQSFGDTITCSSQNNENATSINDILWTTIYTTQIVQGTGNQFTRVGNSREVGGHLCATVLRVIMIHSQEYIHVTQKN